MCHVPRYDLAIKDGIWTCQCIQGDNHPCYRYTHYETPRQRPLVTSDDVVYYLRYLPSRDDYFHTNVLKLLLLPNSTA